MEKKNEIQWFPMRVTYNREIKIKENLDALGIETFMPIKQQFVTYNGFKKLETKPAIHNLLFVHSSREILTDLKMTDEEFSPLRYMMTRPLDNMSTPKIITIPEQPMQNFINAVTVGGNNIIYLDYETVANKIGHRCVICDGPFASIEGTVMRIDNNKRVVIKLENVTAVALAFVPPNFIKFI